MQRGNYDLMQPSETKEVEGLEEEEGTQLLEMTQASTCTLKEIIEGDDEEVEEGKQGGSEGSEDAGDASPNSEGADSGREVEEEEVKANGGEELGKVKDVKVDIGRPSKGPGGLRSTWHSYSFLDKCLITLIIILVLCIFFMAIAWPSVKDGEESSKTLSQKESQKGTTSTVTSALMPSSSKDPLTEETSSDKPTTSLDDEEEDGSTPSPQDSGSRRMQLVEETTLPLMEDNRPVCKDPTCRNLAYHMLALMNDSADPCEDFYNYACGGMRTEGSQWKHDIDYGSEAWTRISDEKTQVNESSPQGLRKFKDFIDSCVNYEKDVPMEARIEKAQNILKNTGEFYKSERWIPDNYGSENFTQLLGNFLISDYSPLLDLRLDVDSLNSSKFAFKLTLPMRQSPFGDSTGCDSQVTLCGWSHEACKNKAMEKPRKGETRTLESRYKEYVNCNVDSRLPEYIEEIKVALKALNISTYENEWTELFPAINSMLKDLKESFPTNDEKARIIAAKESENYAINDLNSQFTFENVNLESLIRYLTDTEVPTKDTKVQVYFGSYIKSLLKKIDDGDLRQWNNVLMAMFTHELYYGLVYHPACNRLAYCLGVAGHVMRDAASSLFLKSFLPEQLTAYQNKINSTFSDIISTLENEINLNMEKEARPLEQDRVLIKDIEVISDGGVSIFQNNTYLDKQFELQSTTGTTYLEKAVELLQMYRRRMYQSHNKNPSDPEQIWFHIIDPISIEGHEIFGLKKIVVPYGMMQKPFFSEEYPLYIQMARLGQKIAKEIWKLLSDIGIQEQYIPSKLNKGLFQSMPGISSGSVFDSEAIIGNSQALEKFTTFYMSDLLADYVAVHLAYKSIWRNNTEENDIKLPHIDLTPKQQFFLAFAQNSCTKSSEYDYLRSIFEELHLPPFTRMNEIARHSPEFREAFSCFSSSQPDDTTIRSESNPTPNEYDS